MSIFSLFISFISLCLSFFIAYRNIWLSRANIEIIQTDRAARSIFIQSYDGCEKSYSDGLDSYDVFKHHNDSNIVSCLLIEIIITNKSSLPISIIEFTTKDFISNAYTSYSPSPEYFIVTTKKNSKVHMGNSSDPIKYLKPEFTIQPYTSERGYILFCSGLEKDNFHTPCDITLKIKTSRKSFETIVKIPDGCKSIKKHVNYYKDDEGNIKSRFPALK